MSLKFSVIIPVYNVENYLSKCLESVLRQDFDSYEIVAVNDGSKDSCGEILKEYVSQNNKLVVVEQENKGLGGARNAGVEKATGEYIFFLDSDDTMAPDTLSQLCKETNENDVDIVCFGMNYVNEDSSIISTRKANENGCRVVTQDEYPLLFANDSYVCNKLFKRKLFIDNNIRFPDRAWYEDLKTLPKLVLKSDRILLSDKVFYNYLQRVDSIMHVPNTDRNIEMIDTVSDVLSYYKKQNAFDKYYESLEYMTVLHVLVFATLRVASIDPKHHLLKKFNTFVKENFPNYKNNVKVKTDFTFRHKLIYEFSKRKMYRMLFLLNKLNKLR